MNNLSATPKTHVNSYRKHYKKQMHSKISPAFNKKEKYNLIPSEEFERLKGIFIDAAIDKRLRGDKTPLVSLEFKSGLSLRRLRRYFAHWSINYYMDGLVNNTILKCGRNKYIIYFGAGSCEKI